MSQSQDGQPPASQVESVDPSEQSIDEQLVQLAQAKLDGQIDQETYERLVGLVRELQPLGDWNPSKSIEYATPPPKEPADYSVLTKTVLVMGLLFATFAFLMVAAPKFQSRGPEARITAAKTDIANLETAVDAFEIDTGRYPKQSEGLAALIVAPPGMSNWHGPYIRTLVNDPWGRPYTYTVPGKKHPSGYDLLSAGPDGKVGTADDISN